MANVDAALATQVSNIEAQTGKSLKQIAAMLAKSGLSKHGEKRKFLQDELGLTYGHANTAVHLATQTDGPAKAASATTDDPLAAIYTGPKAHLRALHDKLIAAIDKFGDYETAPKKAYVSLRRKKQFAMIGPATKDQIEIGLNAKDLPVSGDTAARLKPQPAGSMCNYKLRLSTAKEIDKQVVAWLKAAFEAAG